MSNINLYLKIVASADIAIVEVQNARIFFHGTRYSFKSINC